MPVEVRSFQLGPLANNTYLLVETSHREAIIIDPSFECEALLDLLEQEHLQLTQIWITHAHFDHIAGVQSLADHVAHLQIGLHPADLPLWRANGGANWLGWLLTLQVEPNMAFSHAQILTWGDNLIEVRHTPGHSPGHVIFWLPSLNLAFCGDLIFYHGIGRTDLPGGDFEQLRHSIIREVFTLPPHTRLLPGHGAETSVAEERLHNPWLKDELFP
ncbi:MBL fold metallo-hydrolase [uncultured Thermanaerothrix sp.]|uniref:MBL fold metallo-hydrolase n=1 Tax=uncultured Thermanaerothrix sp. TaxID=1195149 RepID=UPI00262DCA06|nr:MBL fold metallo-hydrolase [uncultured Thermanaerothrix sp.]